jgi:hypothetical protein
MFAQFAPLLVRRSRDHKFMGSIDKLYCIDGGLCFVSCWLVFDDKVL